MATADVGILGGSGFYSFLDDVEHVAVDTPYGPPSDQIAIGRLGPHRVAFLPRHGRDHGLPPHRIPYRANAWAMRELGVKWVLGPCASGSLRADIALGTFVVCDQFIDRTSGREHTVYDGPETVHVAAADPYSPGLRRILVETATEQGIPVRDGGTVVVISGPRFATRAESRWHAAMGGDVVNMTAYPEGWLFRELEIAYATVALVTDYDVGVDGLAAPVTTDAVVRVFAQNNERLRDLLFAAVPRIDLTADDPAFHALEGARL